MDVFDELGMYMEGVVSESIKEPQILTRPPPSSPMYEIWEECKLRGDESLHIAERMIWLWVWQKKYITWRGDTSYISWTSSKGIRIESSWEVFWKWVLLTCKHHP